MKNFNKGSSMGILLAIVAVLIIAVSIYTYMRSGTSTPVVVEKTPDVLETGKAVLTALKNDDYQKLEDLVSSQGLSWNEYPNLDLTQSDVAKIDVSDIPTDTKTYMFGYTDGKGDEIVLTKAEYIMKYIYNHDYLNAKEVAVNENLGGGNSLNTILVDRGNRTVVAYHFSGFDPKYEGMDWTTMYLIFDLEGDQYKLRGIAKDNWTI